MLDTKTWHSLGIVIPFVSAAVLFGLTKPLGAGINDNLFKTGLNLGIILAVLQIILGYAIYNKLT